MGNSVIGSVTAALTRAWGVSIAADFSFITAIKFPAPSASAFQVPFECRHTSAVAATFWEGFQAPTSSTNDINVEYKTTGLVDHVQQLGTNAALAGLWLHLGFTYVGTTGAQAIYALLSGFNPNTPSFLFTPAVGANVAGSLPQESNLYCETGGASNFPGAIGHAIIAPVALTQAQMLQQFAQRAPTPTVKAGGAYTYLPCTSAANVQVDAGTLASNYTKTGAFTDSNSQPIEWNSDALFFGAGTTS